MEGERVSRKRNKKNQETFRQILADYIGCLFLLLLFITSINKIKITALPGEQIISIGKSAHGC